MLFYYFHKDHLGSSAAMTTDAGTVVETSNYMPFGEMREHSGLNLSNYKYTDQEFDPETGLYYYGARYYDPVIGRFISPDSVVQDPYDPQTLNRFTYCRNNPIIYTDPSGNIFGIDDLLAIGIGAAIGAISSGIQSNWNLGAMAIGAFIGGVSGGVFSGVEGAVAGAIKGSITNATLAGTISGAAGGAAAGAVAGGLSTAFYGGNFIENTLVGAGIGGVMGGIMGAINGAMSAPESGVGGDNGASVANKEAVGKLDFDSIDAGSPIKGNSRTNSSYGPRTDPESGELSFHKGIDKVGSRKLIATENGGVVNSGFNASRGLNVVIYNESGLFTEYLHMDTVNVFAGDRVLKGEIIGTMGNTGKSFGTHLHFGVGLGYEPVIGGYRVNGVFNPALYLRPSL